MAVPWSVPTSSQRAQCSVDPSIMNTGSVHLKFGLLSAGMHERTNNKQCEKQQLISGMW